MIRATRTVSSQAASTVIPANQLQSEFRATATVSVTSAADLTFSVQYTIDDIQDPNVTPKWVNTTLASQAVTNGSPAISAVSIDTPVTGVRLDVSAYTDGSATLTYIQADR